MEALTDELLDRLAERTPPADLHAELAAPLPVMVICELLGIPVRGRYAREEIAFGGVTIAPGEAVLFSTGTASHDPRVFTEPGHFDMERRNEPHVVFGYGTHYRLGAPLARIELQAVFERRQSVVSAVTCSPRASQRRLSGWSGA